MTKVLVTGGTGFIGKYLTIRLRERGYFIKILTRGRRVNSKRNDSKNIEYCFGDIRDREVIKRAVNGVEKVFHLATLMQEVSVSNREYWEVNVEGIRNLLEACINQKIKRFVHCSSTAVTGDIYNSYGNEDTPYSPVDIYQKTKCEGEKLVLEYYKRYALPVVIVRPAGVYGPGDWRLVKLFRFIASGKFIMIGTGEQLQHLIYISDLINGIELAAEREGIEGNIFILAGDTPIRLKDFVKKIADCMGIRLNNLKIPINLVMFLATIMEFTCKPFGIQPPLFRRRVDFFRKSYYFDISKAKSMLGFKPEIDIDLGIKLTVEWLRKEGIIRH